MKRNRFILLLIIYTAIFLLLITGCSAQPQSVVDKLLTELKAGNYDAISQYMILQDDAPLDTMIDEDSEGIYSRLFKNLEYSILSTSVDGDDAVVRLKTTNIDMENVASLALTEIFSQSLANMFQENGSELTDEQISQIFYDKMDDPSAQKITLENDIRLKKDPTDKKWKVVGDTVFADSITGNFISAFGNVFSADQQDEAADSNLPGSRSNPIKPGEAGTVYAVGYSDHKSGNFQVSIRVTGTIRGDEAWKLIENENMFNEAAPEGKEYILVKVAAEVIDADTEEVAFSISDYDFEFVSRNGTTLDRASVVTPDELTAELYKGGTTEGYIAGLVDIGDTVDLKYEGLNSSMWFSLE